MSVGKWIVVSFVLFAAFIGVLVAVCMRQDINLVSADYYQKELKHQQKIDQSQNTAGLAVKPVITMSENTVIIYFPQFNQVERGVLTMMRPSDQRLDQHFQLQATRDSTQQFTMRVWEKGLYRASLQWTMADKEYYLENLIIR